MGGVIAFFSYRLFKKHKKKILYNDDGLIKFSLALSIVQVIAVYSFTRALAGNLAVVFTINSFSILIPIILSIIFYKEHFNFKKGLVIVLSIVSIILFI